MKGCNRFQGGAGRAEGASEVVYQLLKKDDQIICTMQAKRFKPNAVVTWLIESTLASVARVAAPSDVMNAVLLLNGRISTQRKEEYV